MANLLEHSALVVIALVLLQSTPLPRSRVGIGPIGLVAAQNSQDQSMDQQEDSNLVDPNLVNPQNRQGYGKNVPTQVLKKEPSNRPTSPNATAKQLPVPTIGEQTLQAAFQLGVLVRYCWSFFLIYVQYVHWAWTTKLVWASSSFVPPVHGNDPRMSRRQVRRQAELGPKENGQWSECEISNRSCFVWPNLSMSNKTYPLYHHLHIFWGFISFFEIKP